MTNDLELDCCEEELSEAQVRFYSDGKKEYEKAMSEVNNIKKDPGSIVTQHGNVWLIKSKVRTPKAPQTQVSTTLLHHPQLVVNNLQNVPNSFMVTRPSNNPSNVSNVPPKLPIIKTPSVNVSQQTPAISTVDETPFPATQLLSQFTATNVKKLKTPPPLPGAQLALTVPATQVTATQSVVQLGGTQKKTIPPTQPSNKPADVMVAIPSNQTTKTSTGSTTAVNNSTKKNVPSAGPPNDIKMLTKTIPSLCVVVRPASTVPDAVNQKKREGLDMFVKSRLVLDPRRFAEWLMQIGLLRTQQLGVCKTHMPMTPSQLQLRMYAEETRFPHSGGYVWITKCCDRNFVSIFRESIFEDATHSPAVLLKLIYHWACQTAISNVVQWVKIEHLYLRLFYAMLRSVCTVEIHSSTPIFGSSAKQGRVEVGVISLGTTSSDGKRRDVKVEVLGVLDQETQKMRLRVSEPIVGETRSRSRFAKILEPLSKWVNKNALILTDFTVERSALEELGFHNVLQKHLNTSEDSLSNQNVMNYLRSTVPKVFQNTLSVLSTASIQLFLDELVWREINGSSSSDAFHNIIRDLSSQVRAETGMPLIKRLPLVSLDPFKDWSISSQPKHTQAPSNETTTSSISGGIKRPSTSLVPAVKEATQMGPSKAKELRCSSYYATMLDTTKVEIVCSPKDAETFCQHLNCQKLISSNLDMMMHMRQHLVKDAGDSTEWNEHCIYCLETLSTVDLKKQHVESHHAFMSSFRVQKTREDSAVVKDIICLICHERFTQYYSLEQHLEKSHVHCEMPYRCRVCHFHTSNHAHLIDHFYEQHKTSSYLLCPLCLDTFSTKGDNLVAGQGNSGHTQYLEHLKHHLPLNKNERCKRCVLTFHSFEQLRYHVRTDHLSRLDKNDTRPFTFTVVKPLGTKLLPLGPIVTFTNSPIKSPPPASTELVSPIASTLASSAVPPVAGTSSSGVKVGLKTYAKDLSQDIPNTSVARRLANVSLTEETQAVGNICIECKEPLKKKNHFGSYLCCTLCRFSTCCGVAMKHHQNLVHKKLHPFFGSVFELSEKVICNCGFTTNSGLHLERHLIQCGEKSVTVVS